MRKPVHLPWVGMGLFVEAESGGGGEIGDVSLIALTPSEIKNAMQALTVNQSRLYDMRNHVDKAIADNAALHQRFAEAWEREAMGIEARLDKVAHDQEQARLTTQSVE
jgi:hypothetical protein